MILSVLYSLILLFFLSIPLSAADAATINPNGIKTLLANDLITIFIKDNPVFSNGPSNLPRNPPDCIILDNWAFDNLISVDERFAKALRRLKTCLLVNNNLWGNLVSLSPIKFDYNLKTTSVSSFIADFNLLSCEFDGFTFKLLYCVILYRQKLNCIQWNCIYKSSTVPCENSKTVSFIFSRIK